MLFERAYSAAPITLHLARDDADRPLSAGHGARDNGMHVCANVPDAGRAATRRGSRRRRSSPPFRSITGSASNRGFDVYGDRMPRGADGRLANERPAGVTVDEAIAWLESASPASSFFLWVHLFEPHAPYGNRVTAGRWRRATTTRSRPRTARRAG